MAFGLKLRKVPKDGEIDARVVRPSRPRCWGSRSLLGGGGKALSEAHPAVVAVGRPSSGSPKSSLMDEPLSNPSMLSCGCRWDELVKLYQRLQTTADHRTHDQTEAMTMGRSDRGHERCSHPTRRRTREIYDKPPDNVFVRLTITPRHELSWRPG